MPSAVAIYTRVSSNPDGSKTSTNRQEEACHRFAEGRGWPVAKVYEDDDVSAFGRNGRPGWEQLLDGIREGKHDAIVFWAFDRAFRRLRDWLDFHELCEERKVVYASTTEPIDTSTEVGRILAGFMVSVAEMEVRRKKARLLEWHKERAAHGKPAGGGNRPFGYEDDRVTVRQEEAELVRDAARRVFRGASLRSICAEWNDRGVRTPGTRKNPAGNRWRTGVLRRLLMSPRIAGLREHRGEVVPAAWDRIVTRKTHERLRELLRDGTRLTNGGDNRRRYLLTGIAYCQRCGARLVARPRADHVRRYVCARGPNFNGCGKTFILAEPLEELVASAAYSVWSNADVQRTLRSDAKSAADLEHELSQALAALDRLSHDYYTQGVITDRKEYLARRSDLEARIKEREAELDEVKTTAASWSDLIKRAESAPRFGRLSKEQFEWWRALLDTVVDRVEIGPGIRGLNRFDPSRVKVVGRTSARLVSVRTHRTVS
jgi:site-specific DNA recombinase